ncbi:uncharacterized protein DS421_4g111580 [Arachis hypogaea]|nr:uncharacterized protein DS421_4g111580 [Arachis hypogaea]
MTSTYKSIFILFLLELNNLFFLFRCEIFSGIDNWCSLRSITYTRLRTERRNIILSFQRLKFVPSKRSNLTNS